MLDGLTCLYKSSVDLFFYVIGSGDYKQHITIHDIDRLRNVKIPLTQSHKKLENIDG